MAAVEMPASLVGETRMIHVFLTNGSPLRQRDVRMNLIREKAEDILPPYPDMQPLTGAESFLRVKENREEIWLWCGGFSLYFNLAKGEGEARLAGDRDWQNVLRVTHFHVYLQQSALMLHASGVIKQGRAVVFPGPSGAGKTTIVRHSPGVTVLSDEIVGVQLNDGGEARAYGTPFYGDWGQPGAQEVAPIKAFYFPRHSQQNRLIPLTQHEVLTRLLPCICTYTVREAFLEEIIDLGLRLAESVPGFDLHFRPGPEFWDVIDGS
jgi:hypothetical protein